LPIRVLGRVTAPVLCRQTPRPVLILCAAIPITVGYAELTVSANSSVMSIDFLRVARYMARYGEVVARVWYVLLESLGDGAEGVRQARSILKEALKLTYPFTRSHTLAK
jgi:hypothetical protein